MVEKKPRKTRPEMGTPEYEEWRKQILERRKKRLQRKRRNRLIAIGTAAVILAGGASAGIGAFKKQSSSDIQKEHNTSDQKASGEVDITGTPSAVDRTGESDSGDTLARAELLAQQYDRSFEKRPCIQL